MGKRVIGIDLGTTNSCVSIMENGVPVIISNSEGQRTTPSVVSFSNGERKIGSSAKRQQVTNIKNTVSSIKRFMGEKYDDVSEEISRVSYNVVKGNNGNSVVDIEGKQYTPQEISAMILQKMKTTAEDYLGESVENSIITVPAWYDNEQRHSVTEAAAICGLKVERLVNEPTSAALAYGLDKKDKDMKIAVFDFGGGTFDVSILESGDSVFEVKSTMGDVHLGGDDIDNAIVDWLVDTFKKEHNGVDLSKDPMSYQRLKEAAEKSKIELSTTSESDINLPYIIPIDNIPAHLVTKLTRSKFEQICDPIFQKLIPITKKALEKSGFNKNEISEVILVGGSTRILAVQKIVKDIFGIEPNKSVNPDEAVAIGAAVLGGIISGDVKDILLLDVLSISVGIETAGKIMTKMIDANSTIPISKEQIFSTYSDNQTSVDINILQGERPLATGNKSLGRFVLENIPSANRGVPQITVKFDINVNGILEVTATDKATGKSQNIRIENSSNLTKEEIERMKAESEMNAESDKKEVEKITTLNQADSLVFQTEKQIEEFSDKLTETDKNNLTEKVGLLKESHKSQNIEDVEKYMKELNETWNSISSNLYNKTNESQEENVGGDSNQNEAQDVDFDEVK